MFDRNRSGDYTWGMKTTHAVETIEKGRKYRIVAEGAVAGIVVKDRSPMGRTFWHAIRKGTQIGTANTRAEAASIVVSNYDRIRARKAVR